MSDLLIIDDPSPVEPMSPEMRERVREWYEAWVARQRDPHMTVLTIDDTQPL